MVSQLQVEPQKKKKFEIWNQFDAPNPFIYGPQV